VEGAAAGSVSVQPQGAFPVELELRGEEEEEEDEGEEGAAGVEDF
jgi:hypothetical protein